MNVWSQISQAAAGTTTVDLPPGWQRALEYNLALELAPEYKPAGPDIIQKAMEAINRIKIANDDNTPVLRSPAQQAVNNNDYNYGDFY